MHIEWAKGLYYYYLFFLRGQIFQDFFFHIWNVVSNFLPQIEYLRRRLFNPGVIGNEPIFFFTSRGPDMYKDTGNAKIIVLSCSVRDL